MIRFLAPRFGRALLSILVVTVLTYLLMSLLPGDPALNILGMNATPERIAALRADLHLDDPFFARYLQWLGDMVHGDLGTSQLTRDPVAETMLERLPVTLEVILFSQLIALGISIPLGIRSALRPDGIIDRLVTSTSFFFLSMPVYVVAVLAVLLISVQLGLLPATGYTPFTTSPLENLRSLLLPSCVLAVGSIAAYSRVLRAEMIATLQEEYIAVARAKGLSTGYILFRHALRPSSFTLLTIAGLNIGGLIGGTVLTERIFGVPGVGGFLLGSILQRDYIGAQGAIVTVAIGFVIINLLVDVAYSILDPRVRRASI